MCKTCQVPPHSNFYITPDVQRIINMFPFNRVNVYDLSAQPRYPLTLFNALETVSHSPMHIFLQPQFCCELPFMLFNIIHFSFPPSLPVETFVFRLAISPSDSSIYLWALLSPLYVLLAPSIHIMLLQSSLSGFCCPPTQSNLILCGCHQSVGP